MFRLFSCRPFFIQYLQFKDEDLQNYRNHFLKQIDWYNHCKYLQYRCLLNILYLTREQFEEITKTFVVILNRSDFFAIFKIFAIENNSYEDVFFGNNKVKISDNVFFFPAPSNEANASLKIQIEHFVLFRSITFFNLNLFGEKI